MDTGPANERPSTGRHLLNAISNDHVAPEVGRRTAAGDWSVGDVVERALVVLGGPRAGQVLLNHELRGVLTIKSGRAVEKGDDVSVEDVAAVEVFVWEDDDGASSYVAVIPTAAGLALLLNFRGNVEDSAPRLDAAEEFLDAALEALGVDRIRVFLDLSFSAVELMAKAELLRWAGNTAADSRKHERVRTAYNAWSHLGNTEPRFAALLNRLGRLRGPARYLDREVTLTRQELTEMAGDLRAMFAHVRRVAPRPGVDPDLPQGAPLKMYAQRDLVAGEILVSDDLALFPPRGR